MEGSCTTSQKIIAPKDPEATTTRAITTAASDPPERKRAFDGNPGGQISRCQRSGPAVTYSGSGFEGSDGPRRRSGILQVIGGSPPRQQLGAYKQNGFPGHSCWICKILTTTVGRAFSPFFILITNINLEAL